MQNRFQLEVGEWMIACFGQDIAQNKVERNYRFLEEALELAQSCECSKEDALRLVEYVYNRPKGDISQEVGGVMVTLAALCNARGTNFVRDGNRELARVWENIEKIRDKQAAKQIKSGPLP